MCYTTEDPIRALRLCQGNFMIRDDGFSFAELPFIVPHSLATTQKAVRHDAAPTVDQMN